MSFERRGWPPKKSKAIGYAQTFVFFMFFCFVLEKVSSHFFSQNMRVGSCWHQASGQLCPWELCTWVLPFWVPPLPPRRGGWTGCELSPAADRECLKDDDLRAFGIAVHLQCLLPGCCKIARCASPEVTFWTQTQVCHKRRAKDPSQYISTTWFFKVTFR